MTTGNNSLRERLRKADQERERPHAQPRSRTGRGIVPSEHREITVFIVAGEHSGDVLGGKLMEAMHARRKGQVRFLGVGGEHMAAQGLSSQFPISDVAVMGPMAILSALPRLIDRVYKTVAAGVAARPDVIVIIDSPEFTHPIAKRLRRKLPRVPIIDYVSPSVWAWRPGRARKMAAYVDHLLALLPFEPAAHERLGGPPCSYVGHPLIERRAWITSRDTYALRRSLGITADQVPLVVLPGSRSTEVERLMGVFGETIAQLASEGRRVAVMIPCVPHLRQRIEELAADWPVPVHYLEGEDAKFAAFRLAHAALAASGTVTLELGVAGTPMVVAYRVDNLAARLRFLVKVPSVVLANLVIEENAFPEFIQQDCTAAKMAPALAELIDDTPARAAQLEALAKITDKLRLPSGSPSEQAAEIVLDYADNGLRQQV